MKAIKKLKKYESIGASILISFVLLSYNIPFFFINSSDQLLFDVCAFLGTALFTSLLVYLLSISVWLTRLLIITLVVINSIFFYFMLFYKVKIYPPVITAIFETEKREVIEWLSLNLLVWVFIFAIPPSYIITKLTKNLTAKKLQKISCLAVCVIIILVINFKHIHGRLKVAIDRYPSLQPFNIANKYLPYNYLYNTQFYIQKSLQDSNKKKIDLTTQYNFFVDKDKIKNTYVVVILGESARADRFSLNGYERHTNPLLSKQKNLISYTNFHSLDTTTTRAVPFIFRRNFNPSGLKESSFIQILKHLGLKTFWISCWATTARTSISSIALESDIIMYAPHLESYNAKSVEHLAYDAALISPLKEMIARHRNGLIVLHTNGSHVNYYDRAPESFHKYSPVCEDLCSNDLLSLNNTYDNTILYTDFVINEVIETLKDKNAILFYVSDHGESLGENGLFIHSAPFKTAPKEQTHVPMIVWASDKFLSDKQNFANFVSMKQKYNQFVDQGWIFHSVLDCLGVKSEAINKNKSLCHSKAILSASTN